jgi:hypothetical protein
LICFSRRPIRWADSTCMTLRPNPNLDARCWILDAGHWPPARRAKKAYASERCRIFSNELMENSKHIEHPETSIQDQPALARNFMATQWLGHRILCNNRSNHEDGGTVAVAVPPRLHHLKSF